MSTVAFTVLICAASLFSELTISSLVAERSAAVLVRTSTLCERNRQPLSGSVSAAVSAS